MDLTPLDAQRRGHVDRLWGIALSSHLQARDVSGRMARHAQDKLAKAGFDAEVEQREDTTAAQPGAGLALFADLSGGCRLGADGAGAPGRPAEAIGSATAHRLLDDLGTGAALDRYASDQVIAFVALASGQTQVRLAAVTDHVRPGLRLAELFGLATSQLDGSLLIVDGGGLIKPNATSTGNPRNQSLASSEIAG